MKATVDNTFGRKELAEFERYCREDDEAQAHLRAGGSIVCDSKDGRAGIEAAIVDGSLAFRAVVYEAAS